MVAGYTLSEWFVLTQHELLLFAGIFFLFGALDEIFLDCVWLRLKLTGQLPSKRVETASLKQQELAGFAAVFIAAWQEDKVIGATIRHMLSAWPQERLRLYVGVYRNDRATLAAAIAAAQGDPRLRLVIHEANGPTTKADCLNRIYRALTEDEDRVGGNARLVLLHDAEDMVDPAALALIDQAMDDYELVQLPVLPLRQANSPFVSGHYCDEFAESHGKSMVIRDAIGASMPLAGVGCAIKRAQLDRMALHRLATTRQWHRPFADESITEDYEMGLILADHGVRAKFLRAWNERGELIATRAYFPSTLSASIRQKTRWIHGIALQGWDRTGWGTSIGEFWMRFRDRRGPFVGLVLASGYLALIMMGIAWVLTLLGLTPPMAPSPLLEAVLVLNLGALVWRLGFRFLFTARHYGVGEGFLAIARIPVANLIAIIAGRKAVFAYVGSIFGKAVTWDKTVHDSHPAHQREQV